MKNNYEILELKYGATKAEIKSKFRKLSLIYHPDMPTGDALKFIEIQKAYENLLKGVVGVKFSGASPKDEIRKKEATYRFISLKKDSKKYILTYNCNLVYEVHLFGKNGIKIGVYSLNCADSNFNLTITFEDMKTADYEITVKLVDLNGNYAKETYKVKPPLKGIKKLINKLFGI